MIIFIICLHVFHLCIFKVYVVYHFRQAVITDFQFDSRLDGADSPTFSSDWSSSV